jgi:hypothetical protein
MLWANVIASWMAQFRAGVPPLLLVIHSSAFEFLALRIGAAGSDGAALAVSRQDNATACGDLAAVLNFELQRRPSVSAPILVQRGTEFRRRARAPHLFCKPLGPGAGRFL